MHFNPKFIETIGFKVFSDNLSKIPIDTVSCKVINTISPNSYGISTRDTEFKEALKMTDYLVLDGVYFAFASLLLQRKNIKRNQGPDVFYHFMERSEQLEKRVFFLGSTSQTLELIKTNATIKYPHITVGTFSPPFKPELTDEDNKTIINTINAFRPDIVFVGMTCPKQEKWAINYREKIDAHLIITIGNVFDWFAGTQKPIKPIWFKLRLGWLIRIFLRPEVFKRNIGNQMKFFWHVIMIFLKLKKMIKGVIIGLGKMGLSHAAIVGAHPAVDMVAVCDTSSLILNAFKKFSKVKTYTDFQKMIDKETPEFVVIATPTKYHYPMVKYALEKGAHVFCEKPFTLTASQGKELMELALRKGLANQVGYHNQFIGTFRELKRLLGKNILGDLVHFTGEAYGPVVIKEKGGTWRSNPEEGGGCLYDYASHVINLVQEVISRPEKIYGTILKSIYSKGVEDAVYSLMKLQNGVSGTLLVNWSDDTYRKMSTSLTVQGKKGKIICDATEIRIYLNEQSLSEKLDKGWTIKYITDFAIPVNFYLRGEEYSAQIDYFVDCIKNKKQVQYNSFEQALFTDLVIEMIVENAKNN